jgi:long-chain fatty acid transport protein
MWRWVARRGSRGPRRLLQLTAMLLALLTPLSPAWAGAIWLYEMATPDQGTAAAGRAALGLDASTAWANPAGMTRLEQSQLLLGIGPLVIQSEFDVKPGTTTSGGGADITSVLPLASGYYVQSLTTDFKLGLGLTTLPGLAADYGDSWAGRYFLEKAALFGVAASPVAAYRILPWLSVGAGPSFGISVLRQDSAINNIAERLPDGELKIRSHGFGVGGVVGVMIEPTATTRFGVQYTTPMSFTYENIIDSVQGLGPGLRTLFIAVGGLLEIPAGSQVDLKLTMPQQVMASAYHQFNDRLALMGNFGWQNWNAFGQPSVIVHGNPNRRFTVDQGYEDTFHTAIGIHYRVAEKWLLMGGFAYDSSAVSDSRRTVAFPVDEQFRYAIGVQWAVTKDITLGAMYTLIDAGSAPINQSRGPLTGTLVGDYSPNLLHAIGFNLAWRF